ncbi:MAG: hypothetical protein HQL88_10150, partial [Magnetococcales bacterium]|nr:hypothetical protein [Magnetococcales bacterium]
MSGDRERESRSIQNAEGGATDPGMEHPGVAKPHAWKCWSGWGVALAVGLVAAPAIRDQWVLGAACRVSSLSEAGERSPALTLPIPHRPTEWKPSTPPVSASAEPLRGAEPTRAVESVGAGADTQAVELVKAATASSSGADLLQERVAVPASGSLPEGDVGKVTSEPAKEPAGVEPAKEPVAVAAKEPAGVEPAKEPVAVAAKEPAGVEPAREPVVVAAKEPAAVEPAREPVVVAAKEPAGVEPAKEPVVVAAKEPAAVEPAREPVVVAAKEPAAVEPAKEPVVVAAKEPAAVEPAREPVVVAAKEPAAVEPVKEPVVVAAKEPAAVEPVKE